MITTADKQRAYDVVWRGLGARPGESLYGAAKRARENESSGTPRAQAAALIVALHVFASPAERWRAIFAAAEHFRPRLVVSR